MSEQEDVYDKNSKKTKARREAMDKALTAMLARGVELTDFKAVIISMQSVLGKEKVKEHFVNIKTYYNQTYPDFKYEGTYEELIFNKIGKNESFQKSNLSTTQEMNFTGQSKIIIGDLANYPQIHLPREIVENLDKIFPQPVAPISPIPPIPPNKATSFLAFISMIFIAIILFFIKLPIGGLIIIVFSIYILFSNSDKNKYENDLKIYNSGLNNFNKAIVDYENELKIIDPENYQTYKRNKANERVLKFSAQYINNEDYKKGISHNYFKKFLVNSFGDSIIESVSINSQKYYSRTNFDLYITDFAFIDKHTNLKIDIEIDEPYTLKDKQAIHLDDKERNDFFIEHNWLIIRFAEEQVIKHPELCCKLIKEVINCFDNNFLLLKNLKSELPKVKKWNFEVVNQLIFDDYRNSYLNKKDSFYL